MGPTDTRADPGWELCGGGGGARLGNGGRRPRQASGGAASGRGRSRSASSAGNFVRPMRVLVAGEREPAAGRNPALVGKLLGRRARAR
jgi:hypothetical protein